MKTAAMVKALRGSRSLPEAIGKLEREGPEDNLQSLTDMVGSQAGALGLAAGIPSLRMREAEELSGLGPAADRGEFSAPPYWEEGRLKGWKSLDASIYGTRTTQGTDADRAVDEMMYLRNTPEEYKLASDQAKGANIFRADVGEEALGVLKSIHSNMEAIKEMGFVRWLTGVSSPYGALGSGVIGSGTVLDD